MLESEMTPKKTRRYPTLKKTSTKEGKRNYMQHYMVDYRKMQREALKQLQTQHPDIFETLFGKRRRK